MEMGIFPPFIQEGLTMSASGASIADVFGAAGVSSAPLAISGVRAPGENEVTGRARLLSATRRVYSSFEREKGSSFAGASHENLLSPNVSSTTWKRTDKSKRLAARFWSRMPKQPSEVGPFVENLSLGIRG